MSKQLIILKARVLGYCMGVRRAVLAAEKALLDSPLRPVYTYGPLIHNPQAIEKLKKAGVIILDSDLENLPKSFEGRTVVVRAHGITPTEMKELKQRNAKIVDATCPRVISSQKRANKYYKLGYSVFLAGDKSHGEMVSVSGFAPGAIVLQDASEASAVKNWPQKAVLLSQTTMKQTEYDEIARVLKKNIVDLTILKTICPATQERQDALIELAKEVDGVIVVGGKNSANTQRLFLTAKKFCKKAWHIETEKEIPNSIWQLNKIGITAGASTPDATIEAIELALKTKK